MPRLIIVFALSLFLSCAETTSEKEIVVLESITEAGTHDSNFTDYSDPFNRLIWSTEFDTVKNDFALVSHRKINSDILTPEKLIEEINSAWEIQLVFRRISHDTIYVAIPDSDYLTQRIGSTGAANYISSTTYNLTELKGIRYVNYDFKEGDHLSPGTKTREDFKNYR